MVTKVHLGGFNSDNPIRSETINRTIIDNYLLSINKIKKNLSQKSLFLFSYDNYYRLKILDCVTSNWFLKLINVINIISSLFLIFETNETFPEITDVIAKIFIAIYSFEFLLKIIAFGFVLDENTYLRDPWNVLDLLVCLSGLISLLPQIADNLFIVRVLRIIRPMKVVFVIPNMKSFIYTLIFSMLDISAVFMILFFFFILFALLGLSLWTDIHDYRCRMDPYPVNGTLTIDKNFQKLCGGVNKCNNNLDLCLSSKNMFSNNNYFMMEKSKLDNGMINFDDELYYSNFNYGITNFRNFMNSLYIVFQSTTTEGWTDLMYMVMDANSYYMSIIYFFLLIIINNFFLLNLTVAVLLYNFEKNAGWTTQEMLYERIIYEENNREKRLSSFKAPTGSDNNVKKELNIKLSTNNGNIKENINDANFNKNNYGHISNNNLSKNNNFLVSSAYNNSESNMITKYNNLNSLNKLQFLKNEINLLNHEDVDSNENNNLDNQNNSKDKLDLNKNNGNLLNFEKKNLKLNICDSQSGNNKILNEEKFNNGTNLPLINNSTSNLNMLKDDKNKVYFNKIINSKRNNISIQNNLVEKLEKNKKNFNNRHSLHNNKINSLPEKIKNEPLLLKKYRKKYQKIKEIEINKTEKIENIRDLIYSIKNIKLLTPIKKTNNYHINNKLAFYCYLIINQPMIQYIFYCCILLNSIILTLDRTDQPTEEIRLVENLNVFLVVIFAFENFLIFVGLGFKKFIQDPMNIWDSIVVIFAIIEINVINRYVKDDNKSNTSIGSVFRILRILRLFKLIRSWNNFKIMIMSIFETMKRMINYFFLLCLFIYIYALIGCNLFKNSLKFNRDTDKYDPSAESSYDNFDNFQNSVLSVFYLFIGDGWYNTFFDCFRSEVNNRYSAVIYFISIVLFMQISLVNIFLAYLIDNFKLARRFLHRNTKLKNFLSNIIHFSLKKHNNEILKQKKNSEYTSTILALMDIYANNSENKSFFFESKILLNSKITFDFSALEVTEEISFDKLRKIKVRLKKNSRSVDLDDLFPGKTSSFNMLKNFENWEFESQRSLQFTDEEDKSKIYSIFNYLEFVLKNDEKNYPIFSRNNKNNYEEFTLEKKSKKNNQYEYSRKNYKEKENSNSNITNRNNLSFLNGVFFFNEISNDSNKQLNILGGESPSKVSQNKDYSRDIINKDLYQTNNFENRMGIMKHFDKSNNTSVYTKSDLRKIFTTENNSPFEYRFNIKNKKSIQSLMDPTNNTLLKDGFFNDKSINFKFSDKNSYMKSSSFYENKLNYHLNFEKIKNEESLDLKISKFKKENSLLKISSFSNENKSNIRSTNKYNEQSYNGSGLVVEEYNDYQLEMVEDSNKNIENLVKTFENFNEIIVSNKNNNSQNNNKIEENNQKVEEVNIQVNSSLSNIYFETKQSNGLSNERNINFNQNINIDNNIASNEDHPITQVFNFNIYINKVNNEDLDSNEIKKNIDKSNEYMQILEKNMFLKPLKNRRNFSTKTIIGKHLIMENTSKTLENQMDNNMNNFFFSYKNLEYEKNELNSITMSEGKTTKENIISKHKSSNKNKIEFLTQCVDKEEKVCIIYDEVTPERKKNLNDEINFKEINPFTRDLRKTKLQLKNSFKEVLSPHHIKKNVSLKSEKEKLIVTEQSNNDDSNDQEKIDIKKDKIMIGKKDPNRKSLSINTTKNYLTLKSIPVKKYGVNKEYLENSKIKIEESKSNFLNFDYLNEEDEDKEEENIEISLNKITKMQDYEDKFLKEELNSFQENDYFNERKKIVMKTVLKASHIDRSFWKYENKENIKNNLSSNFSPFQTDKRKISKQADILKISPNEREFFQNYSFQIDRNHQSDQFLTNQPKRNFMIENKRYTKKVNGLNEEYCLNSSEKTYYFENVEKSSSEKKTERDFDYNNLESDVNWKQNIIKKNRDELNDSREINRNKEKKLLNTLILRIDSNNFNELNNEIYKNTKNKNDLNVEKFSIINSSIIENTHKNQKNSRSPIHNSFIKGSYISPKNYLEDKSLYSNSCFNLEYLENNSKINQRKRKNMLNPIKHYLMIKNFILDKKNILKLNLQESILNSEKKEYIYADSSKSSFSLKHDNSSSENNQNETELINQLIKKRFSTLNSIKKEESSKNKRKFYNERNISENISQNLYKFLNKKFENIDEIIKKKIKEKISTLNKHIIQSSFQEKKILIEFCKETETTNQMSFKLKPNHLNLKNRELNLEDESMRVSGLNINIELTKVNVINIINHEKLIAKTYFYETHDFHIKNNKMKFELIATKSSKFDKISLNKKSSNVKNKHENKSKNFQRKSLMNILKRNLTKRYNNPKAEDFEKFSFKFFYYKIKNHVIQSSLGILHRDSFIRKLIMRLILSKQFNIFIMIIITFNTIFLLIDNPWNDPEGSESKLINIFNIIFTIIFMLEAIFKILGLGLFFRQKERISKRRYIKYLESQKDDDSINISSSKFESSASHLATPKKNSNTILANKSKTSIKNNSSDEIIKKSKLNLSMTIDLETESIISNSQKPYLSSISNCIDFFVVVLGFIDLMDSADIKPAKYFKTLRLIRSLRPIRIFTKSNNLKIILSCLLKSIPAIGNTFIICGVFIYIYAIIGIGLYKDNMTYNCSIEDFITKETCLAADGKWVYNINNFDNFVNALRTLFCIMMVQGWVDISNLAHRKTASFISYIYFISFIIFGYLFVLNLIISVVIEKYKSLKNKNSKLFTLSDEEREWIKVQKIMLKFRPLPKIELENASELRKRLFKYTSSKNFENLISSLILVSMSLLVIQYNGASNQYNYILDYLNIFFTLLFNLELIIKLYVYRRIYFYSNWNKLDFIINFISNTIIILNILQYLNIFTSNNSFSNFGYIFRAFRILRVIRLMTVYSKLRGIIDTLVYLVPSILNIGTIMIIILVIYGCIGVNLFSTLPLREEIHELNNFRDFISAFVLLFKILTGESWNSIMYEAAYHECTGNYTDNTTAFSDYFCSNFNETCTLDDNISYADLLAGKGYSCGNNVSYLYFISFMIVGPIFIMNLCIVMVVEGFSESMYENESLLSQEEMDNFISVWINYDTNFKKKVHPHELVLILKQLQPPLGFNYDRFYIIDPIKLNYSLKKVKKHKKMLTLYEQIMRNSSLEKGKNKSNLIKTNQSNKKIYQDYKKIEALIINKWSNNKSVSLARNFKKNFDDRFATLGEDREIPQITRLLNMLQSGNLKRLKNSYEIQNFFFSLNKKFWTTNIEILQIMNIFKFAYYDEKKKMKSVNDQNISQISEVKHSFIDNELYIHFVDACLALSRLVVSKKNTISIDKLRENVVGRFTQKLWKNKFKNDRVDYYFKKDHQMISEKLGFRIISKVKNNLVDKLNDARKRIARRKKIEEDKNVKFLEEMQNFKRDVLSPQSSGKDNKIDYAFNNTLLKTDYLDYDKRKKPVKINKISSKILPDVVDGKKNIKLSGNGKSNNLDIDETKLKVNSAKSSFNIKQGKNKIKLSDNLNKNQLIEIPLITKEKTIAYQNIYNKQYTNIDFYESEEIKNYQNINNVKESEKNLKKG